MPFSEYPFNAAQVVNNTSQVLEVWGWNSTDGGLAGLAGRTSPGGEVRFRGECQESLAAFWEDGTLVALRPDPLCRGETWVVEEGALSEPVLIVTSASTYYFLSRAPDAPGPDYPPVVKTEHNSGVLFEAPPDWALEASFTNDGERCDYAVAFGLQPSVPITNIGPSGWYTVEIVGTGPDEVRHWTLSLVISDGGTIHTGEDCGD